MRSRSTSTIAVIGLALLVQACAPAPVQEQPPPSQPAEETPEITLNLPEQNECVCVSEDSVEADYTFLEKGFAALAAGNHVEAEQYFQRYQRLESSDAADWEASVAIAYLHAVTESPLYNADAARKSYRQLRKADWKSMRLHQQTLIIRQALEGFLEAEREMAELEEANVKLQEDLEKREEALKRLRELTLGQKGASQ